MSGSDWGRLRDIVLDTVAAEKHDDFEVELPRFAEAWKALEWLLCRTPDVGVPRVVGTTTYYLYKQDSDVFALTPVITVLYTFNHNQVIIHDVKAEEANRQQQGTA